jgi:Ca2+-binding RTX toxin-like protein
LVLTRLNSSLNLTVIYGIYAMSESELAKEHNRRTEAMVFSKLNLSNLNGSNGFIINGIQNLNRFGDSVSDADDINGDGIDDLIIGAPFASPNGTEYAGQSYVVFGRSSGFAARFNISNLNGSNGFVFDGTNELDLVGDSVSGAGDINGDGLDDLIIGASEVKVNDKYGVGQSYVVFGRSSGFDASFSRSNLSGGNGFIINGISGLAGFSVSKAGDVNSDGIDDLIIGAPEAAINGNTGVGQIYVVFGNRGGFSASLDLSSLNGSNGFIINGIQSTLNSGFSVSGAGDVNDDGIDDLLIGTPPGDESYVVFGRSSGFSSSLDLSSLNGSNGFALKSMGDSSGRSVSSAGDINGDGLDDLIIGSNIGRSYVVFGSSSEFGASLNLSSLNGKNGFTIIQSDDEPEKSVSGAGDINGDGLDDLIIGTPYANRSTGRSYVVFGSSSGFGASLNLSSLNGSNGFIVNGSKLDNKIGASVSGAGDINGDGLDDLIIGAPYANLTGQSYVVYGFIPGLTLNSPLIDATNLTRGAISVNLSLSTGTLVIQQALGPKALNLPGYQDVKGTRFADTLIGNALANNLTGNGGDDLLDGRQGNDTLLGGRGRDTYIIDGPSDTIIELADQGIDLVRSSISYTLGANLERLEFQQVSKNLNGTGNDLDNKIVGNADINVLNGKAGNDKLRGGAGNDTLKGELGNDTLDGGKGYDVLVGDIGDDRFYYSTGVDFVGAAIGVDVLTDFSRVAGNTDKVVLNRSTFKAGTSFASVATDTLAATSTAHITFSTATGRLFYNQNGVGAGLGTGGQFATFSDINGNPISGANTLLAADFAVVT